MLRRHACGYKDFEEGGEDDDKGDGDEEEGNGDDDEDDLRAFVEQFLEILWQRWRLSQVETSYLI